jgi:hypothetical protein
MRKNALEMINDIDDEMLLSAIKKTEKKKNILRFGKLRWTAVAAAIALVVAVPVVAEVFGFNIDFTENGKRIEISTNAVFAAEEFSEEVRAVKGQEFFIMQDMEEAEDFIGINMPDNAVLDEAYPDYVQIDFFSEGNPQRVHCYVFVGENEGNLLTASTEAWYIFGDYETEGIKADDITATVNYKAVCDQNPSAYISGYGFEIDGIYPESEKYVTPSGRECDIVLYNSYEFRAKGVTVVDRILVVVEVSGNSREDVFETVTEILDAYN